MPMSYLVFQSGWYNKNNSWPSVDLEDAFFCSFQVVFPQPEGSFLICVYHQYTAEYSRESLGRDPESSLCSTLLASNCPANSSCCSLPGLCFISQSKVNDCEALPHSPLPWHGLETPGSKVRQHRAHSPCLFPISQGPLPLVIIPKSWKLFLVYLICLFSCFRQQSKSNSSSSLLTSSNSFTESKVKYPFQLFLGGSSWTNWNHW